MAAEQPGCRSAMRTRYRVRPRLPRHTIRVRLAVLFFAVFLASGAALLAVTVAVWQSRTGGVLSTAVPVPSRSLGTRRPASPSTAPTGISS